MAAAVLLDRLRVDEDVAVAHLGAKRRRVVGEGVQGAAAGEVELGVVPVAGEDAVGDGAAVQREAHVRAAVVDRVDLAFVEDDEDRVALGGNDLEAVALEFGESADADGGSRSFGGGHDPSPPGPLSRQGEGSPELPWALRLRLPVCGRVYQMSPSLSQPRRVA